MTDHTQNSRNPANDASLAGAFEEILGKFLAGVDDMLPAIVIAYDRTENRVSVRPLVQILRVDNSVLTRAEIANIPVLNIGGGNVVLSFNINPGDLGWIKANDRDISLFLQSESDEAPNTLRKHSFSDAIFIPDQFRKWTLNAEDDSAAVLQTLDGNHRIVIHSDRVSMKSTLKVEIESDVLIDLNAPTIALRGGLVTADGTIDAVTDVIAGAGNTSLVGHTHSQGTDSAGDVEVETNAPT